MLSCTYVIIRSSYRRRAHCRQLYQCRNQDRQRNRQSQHHVQVQTPWMGGLCCHQKLTTAYNKMFFCCLRVTLRLLDILVINTSTSSAVNNKRRRLLLPECHQLTTVRSSCVYNTWRSNRWQRAMKPDIGRVSRFCLPYLHSTSQLRGPRRNIAITFG